MTTTAAKTPARRPATAKKPADRKPKAPAKSDPAVKKVGDVVEVTHLGVTVTISPDALNDYELFIDMNSGNVALLPSILHRLFGEEKHREVIEALRDPETKRVRLEGDGSVSEFIGDIFGAINPNS
jgi:hypothetical protein